MPPYWRDVELSACMNAPNSLPCCSLGIPIPVSRTVTHRYTSLWLTVRGRQRFHSQHDLALMRELEGVADEIREHLAEAERVANEPVGDRRAPRA